MIYFLVFLILLLCFNMYCFFARKYGIVAHVNERSSHQKPVVTGAGIVFCIGYILYIGYLFWHKKSIPLHLSVAAILLAIVSFVDDIKEIWFFIRLCIHFLAVFLLMWQLKADFQIHIFSLRLVDWFAVVFLAILFVGGINLYNFMDGVNGMIGGLSLAFFISTFFINTFVVKFIDSNFLIFLSIPCLIFMFFNFRNSPACFCGDVGSIFLGFMVMYVLCSLIIKTENFVYILLFSVVIIEAGYTVLQRLLIGQNIFKPHRIHLFQLLCNQGEKSHLCVSSFYFGIQIFLGIFVSAINYFAMPLFLQYVLSFIIFLGLSIWYILYKRKMMGGHLLEEGKPIREFKKLVIGKE